MREIKFRGKNENGWHHGLLTYMFNSYAISHVEDENTIDLIDRETVSQYTGLKDKNGTEIFEGDICKLRNGLEGYWYVVEYVFAGFQLVTYKKKTAEVRGIANGINQCYLEPDVELTVIGNIYENSELLENDNE